MKVRNLLETKGKDIVSIDIRSSVEDAIRAMNTRKISAIMITEQGKTLGIFTERDVVRCYIASGGKSFHDIAVKDHMIDQPAFLAASPRQPLPISAERSSTPSLWTSSEMWRRTVTGAI